MNKKVFVIIIVVLFFALLSVIFATGGLQGKIRRIDDSRDFKIIRQNNRIVLSNISGNQKQVFILDSTPKLNEILNKSKSRSFFSLQSEIVDAAKKANEKKQDLDGDGLSFSDEEKYGTDPSKFDTDSDGLSDGYEVDNKLNPLNPDSDYDGIKDGDELKFGTNPNDASSVYKKLDKSVDADGDTLSDFFELSQNFFSYFDPKVPEDAVLWSGEGKEGNYTFNYSGKFYTFDYQFSNCSEDNSVMVVNFPETGLKYSRFRCSLDKSICEREDVGLEDLLSYEGIKGFGYFIVLSPFKYPGVDIWGKTCFGKSIVWK